MRIHRGTRFLSSVLLLGALAMPLGLQAQERDRDRDNDRDHDRNQRVYDRDHKDYHAWNQNEDRYYRQWYTQTYHGRDYRDFNRLDRKNQEAYWKWRHQHGDHDRDRDHDRDDRR